MGATAITAILSPLFSMVRILVAVVSVKISKQGAVLLT